MQINGINCTDYVREGTMVTMQFADTTYDEVESLDFSELLVTMNTGELAEKLCGFSELVSVSKNIATGIITAVARIPTDLEKQINDVESWAGSQITLLSRKNTQLETENKQLTSKLDAAIQSNQMLEDCLVEMAEIVYA